MLFGGKTLKIMNRAAVQEIRREMDAAKTGKAARQKMARLALSRPNLTACGREEWEREL